VPPDRVFLPYALFGAFITLSSHDTDAHPHGAVSNTVRLLTKVIPNMFEDPAWDGFWWTPTPLGVITTLPGEKVRTTSALRAATAARKIIDTDSPASAAADALPHIAHSHTTLHFQSDYPPTPAITAINHHHHHHTPTLLTATINTTTNTTTTTHSYG
jgi:hypothetical protein